MSDKKIGFWRGRVRSFGYAWAGIKSLFRHESNAKFHLGAAVIVIAAGFIFDISIIEWCLVTLCIAAMFAAEAFNTSIEKLADHVCRERHPQIGLVKDLSAGAVLFVAIAVAVIGLLIFIPKIISMFM